MDVDRRRPGRRDGRRERGRIAQRTGLERRQSESGGGSLLGRLVLACSGEHETLGRDGSRLEHETVGAVAQDGAQRHAAERARRRRVGGVQIGVRVEPDHGEIGMPPGGVSDGADGTPQSPPMSMTGSVIGSSSRSTSSRVRRSVLKRCTPVSTDSPASSGIATVVHDARGRSPAIACAPSMSCIARDDGDPCHCGTITNRAMCSSSLTVPLTPREILRHVRNPPAGVHET